MVRMFELVFTIGDLVTWREDQKIGVDMDVGVVVGLEARGDDDSRLSGVWVKWASNSTGWSPSEMLMPLGEPSDVS